MFDAYHLPLENATFRFVIWHGHPWGGRFQMSVIGERQVTGPHSVRQIKIFRGPQLGFPLWNKFNLGYKLYKGDQFTGLRDRTRKDV